MLEWVALLFWVLLSIVFYTYLGYGILLWILVFVKKITSSKGKNKPGEVLDWPEVTFLVAAWNEEDYIRQKIENCLAFDYPAEKLHLVFVTDGSTDRTPEIIKTFPFPPSTHHHLHHQPERQGKIAAVERVMSNIKSPITIFSDANTNVNSEAIKKIVRHYSEAQVGAVAGEKRIAMASQDDAVANEGIYWKYESYLKRMDSELHTVVGAAGELFSIRTNLFEKVPPDTIVEDFYLTMRIAQKGYRVVYEPDAFALETKSAAIREELKRKIRIAAGGFQAISRLPDLLNPFKYGLLSFQYISHRILRWTVAPASLPLLMILNIVLLSTGKAIYFFLLICQSTFYALALAGLILEDRKLKIKVFFVPFYFCMMNYALVKGFFRFLSGRQSVLWERARRS